MLKEIPPEQIQAAIGKRVRVVAFGIPYEGVLKSFDQETARLQIQDSEDEAQVEQDRIEDFEVLD